MASSLSNLVNNITEGIHEIKCKYKHNDKKLKNCGFKYKDCDCFLEYPNFKGDLIEHKSLCCKKNYQKEFDEKLKKRLFNTFKFSNYDINKFILLLQKGVYPYEYMDDWEQFNETSLPEKQFFYSRLNKEDITDADYTRRRRVCKDFEIKNLGQFNGLYVQSDT